MTKPKADFKELTKQVLRASSHPLRLDIQCILFNRVASPVEIAQELDEDISTVSYHVEVLESDGVIELVKTEPRRGAVEHFYKAVTSPTHTNAAWAKLSRPTRRSITAVTLRGMIGEAFRAVLKDTFDARTDRHLSWIPMELDEEGWAELRERMAAWLEETEQIKADAAKRLAETGDRGSRFFSGIMGFETPPGLGLTNHRNGLE
jgi:DNA-binding transcriptional ArsR family regulator